MSNPLVGMLADTCASMMSMIPQECARQLAKVCQEEGTTIEKAARQDASITAAVLAGVVIGLVASRDYIWVQKFRDGEITPEVLEAVIRAMSPTKGEPRVLQSGVTIEMIDKKLKHYEGAYKKAN